MADNRSANRGIRPCLTIQAIWLWSGISGFESLGGKTRRKYNGAMIHATQSIKEFQESGLLPVVSESCPTKIFLVNPEMDRKVYREASHLNDTELDLIGGLVPPGQMLISQSADVEESGVERGFHFALDDH